jgi:argininosuccinate lyase
MKLWDGRFRTPLDREALRFSSSLDVDRRLFREDIQGSLAHVAMLARRRILSRREASRIQKGLREILREEGPHPFAGPRHGRARFTGEDIHMAIEARLIEKIGPLGGKLHTARSRNDQVALDERLYLVRVGTSIRKSVRLLQRALLKLAGKHREVILPGYTHLQRAQPILLAHHLLAYVAMFDRDHDRFDDSVRRSRVSPLGSGALAGTSFPIDRRMIARMLKLDGIEENSIDAVSDRDGLVEFVSACAISMMHLSRLSEELILWSSQEWRFLEIGDAFTSGSSIMPQKKNPDLAELIRGKSGRVYGDLVALLTIMKGLPLAYNRDLQEDKTPLFDAAESTERSFRIMARMLGSVRFRTDRFTGELRGDLLLSTELADYLVRKGVPFRTAHGLVSALAGECIRRRISLAELPFEEYRKRSRHFGRDVLALLDPGASIRLKRSEGSTAPAEVRRMIRQWERKLLRKASVPARRSPRG